MEFFNQCCKSFYEMYDSAKTKYIVFLKKSHDIVL